MDNCTIDYNNEDKGMSVVESTGFVASGNRFDYTAPAPFFIAPVITPIVVNSVYIMKAIDRLEDATLGSCEVIEGNIEEVNEHPDVA